MKPIIAYLLIVLAMGVSLASIQKHTINELRDSQLGQCERLNEGVRAAVVENAKAIRRLGGRLITDLDDIQRDCLADFPPITFP